MIGKASSLPEELATWNSGNLTKMRLEAGNLTPIPGGLYWPFGALHLALGLAGQGLLQVDKIHRFTVGAGGGGEKTHQRTHAWQGLPIFEIRELTGQKPTEAVVCPATFRRVA